MKQLIFTAAAFVAMTSFGQNTTIQGQIDNPNSDYVTISIPSYEYGKEGVQLDSIALNDGKFTCSIQLDSITELSLYDGKEYGSFTLKPGDDINIYINAPIFDESIRFSGKGAERNNLMSSILIAKELFIGNMYAMPSDISFSDTTQYYEDIQESINTLNKVIDAGIESNPEMTAQLDLQKNTLTRLVANFKFRKKFEITMVQLKESTKGEAFLDFEAEDLEGNKKSLKDFLGKPVIIDFWATWCGPCKREMPHLKKIEEEFDGEINILSMNVYDDKQKWKDQAEGLGAEASVHMTRENFDKMNSAYMISYIPRFVILDAKGKIIDIDADRPSKDLSKQIKKILK